MKKVVSILLSLVLSVTCSMTLIGCTNNGDSSSSPIDSSSPADSSPAPSVPQKLELVSADEQLKNNLEDISLLDIKKSDGNYLPLLFKNISVGSIAKTLIDKKFVNSDNQPIVNLDLYDDGYWRSLDGGKTVDYSLNAIFNYVPYSGEPLALTEADLALYGNKKIADLVFESVFGWNIKIEDMVKLSQMGGGNTFAKLDSSTDQVSGMTKMMVLMATITGDKDTFELVKPVLYMTVRDFYDITVDGGESFIKGYTEKDIDTYIGFIASLFMTSADEVNLDTIAAVKRLASDILNGSLAAPVVNADLPVETLIDDISAIVNIYYRNEKVDSVVAILKQQIGGTISQPVINNDLTVESVSGLIKDVALVAGADKGITEATVALVNSLFKGSVGAPEVNLELTVNQLVANIQAVLDAVSTKDPAVVETTGYKAVVDTCKSLSQNYGELTLADLIEQGMQANIADLLEKLNNYLVGLYPQKTETINKFFALAEKIFGGTVTEPIINTEYADTQISAVINEVAQIIIADGADENTVNTACNLINSLVSGTVSAPVVNTELKVTELTKAAFDFIKAALGSTEQPDDKTKTVLDAATTVIENLFKETTVAQLSATIKTIKVDDAVSALGSVLVAAAPEQEELIGKFVKLGTDLLDGTLSTVALDNTVKINVVISDLNEICRLLGLTDAEADLNALGLLFGDADMASVLTVVATMDIDDLFEFIVKIAVNHGLEAPFSDIISDALTLIFDGTVSEIKVSEEFLGMKVSEVDERFFCGMLCAEDSPLNAFADFTVGEIADYLNGQENTAIDNALASIKLSDIIDFPEENPGTEEPAETLMAA